jgi:hypothetical protein
MIVITTTSRRIGQHQKRRGLQVPEQGDLVILLEEMEMPKGQRKTRQQETSARQEAERR